MYCCKYSDNENALPNSVLNLCTKVGKRTFLLSRYRWLGGSLSNFRIILKLLYYLKNLPKTLTTPKRKQYKKYLYGFNLRKTPYLPSLFISLVDHHCSLNEAKSLGIKTIQCLQINHSSFFADINLVMGNSPLTITFFICLIKEALVLGALQDRLYFENYTRKSWLRQIHSPWFNQRPHLEKKKIDKSNKKKYK
jgi:ribosomal protein S2